MHTSRVLLVLGALLLTACGGDGATGPKTGDSTTTELSCAGSGGKTSCTIPIAGKSSFTVTVESTSCEARGNILRVVSPAGSVLSEDACFLTPDQKWDYPGPFAAAAVLNMSVTAKFFNSPPSLQVSTVEEGRKWRIVFEDGYDEDFNDVILIVTAN